MKRLLVLMIEESGSAEAAMLLLLDRQSISAGYRVVLARWIRS